MRLIAKPPSARSFVPAGRRMLVVAGSLAIAIAATGSFPQARAQTGDTAPVFAVTYFDVAQNALGQGIDLLKRYRESSKGEPANVEFTVLQEMHRPNRFVIVEGWKDKAGFEGHDKGAAKTAFENALASIRNSPPDRHMLQPFATAPAHAAPTGDAVYMVEHIDFMGGNPALAAAMEPPIERLTESSRKEEGAVRYDMYRQPPPRVNHYEVVSVWKNAEAFDAHETASHTRQFRADTVMGGPVARGNLYDQRLYKVL